MGIVEEVGSGVTGLQAGDRGVIPFQIACGSCYMCDQGLQTQCETTQVREHGMGAMLFGYTKLYGQVPGAQAEYLRVPRADYGPVKVPEGPGDDRFVYLSDVLPTAWQAVEYAGVGAGDTLVVLGAGPIGDMASRIAVRRGVRTITVDLVAERLSRVANAGAEAVDLDDVGKRELGNHIREMTGGRGPDAVVDAVGMEAHGSPGMHAVHKLVGLLPDAIAEPMMNKAGMDKMAALYSAFDIVRRGGTVSLVGVYGGMADPVPMLTLFDKQVQLRMGQANVKRWVPDILPLLVDEDPLGVDSFATHHLPLDDAPAAYQMFQEKKDGAVKVVFRP
jgi:threonine dehydrogenase-like Zn-dependent dehydrogenase